MYPVFRFLLGALRNRNRPMGLFEPHVSRHICWPWDLDPWMELNNGRTLTLFDLGRLPLGQRSGVSRALKENGWGMTVAGNSTRYRRRVRMFHRVEMQSRLIGWDGRFLYFEQSMWRRGEALNQMLARLAVTDGKGILPPAKLIAAIGHGALESPPLPGWVEAWIAADALRIWPPELGPVA